MSHDHAVTSTHPQSIDAAFDAAIAELERLDANGHTTADLIEAREQYRQRARDASDAAVAERVRQVLTEAEPDLAHYILTGRKLRGTLQSVLDDAERVGLMLGCSLMGANEYFGGSPSDKIVADWTFALERRMALVKAMVAAEPEGGSHE